MNDMPRLDQIRAVAEVESPAQFTLDEFTKIVETGVFEGWKVELDQGIIVRMSPSQRLHTYYKTFVDRELYEAFRTRATLWTVCTELTLRLGSATLREADNAVIATLTPEKEYSLPSDVLLVVEVSVTTRDYDVTNKARDYAAAGIPHYWVVDVENRQTLVMSDPADGSYGEPRPVPFGQPLAVPDTDQGITIV